MSKKYKWSFIEDKDARVVLLKGSDELKAFAKAYYVKYKNCYDEIMEPYRGICEGISGAEGTKMPLYIEPELLQIFGEEAQRRCSEEHARLKAGFEAWEFLLTWMVVFHLVPEDKIKRRRNKFWKIYLKCRGQYGKSFMLRIRHLILTNTITNIEKAVSASENADTCLQNQGGYGNEKSN